MEAGRTKRQPTGIPGLDELLIGGTVPGASIMVEGLPGSGKSTMAMQIMYAGIERGEPGIYVTLDESGERIYRDAQSYGWDFRKLENENKLRVIPTSPEGLVGQVQNGGPLIEAAREIGARLVVVDSVTMLETLTTGPAEFRQFYSGLVRGLEAADLRVLMVRDMEPQTGGIAADFWSRYTPDVLVDLEMETVHFRLSRRSMEVVKTRGQDHIGGKHAFRITDNGMVVFPRIMPPPSEEVRYPTPHVPSGIPGLDEMLHGGFILEQPVLVSGPTGSGKTLLSLYFLAECAKRGEPALLFTTEETPAATIAHAASIGLDLRPLIDEGLLDIEYIVQTELSIDELLFRLRSRLASKPYRRLAIDSVNSIARMSPDASFTHDAIMFLMGLLRSEELTSIMTYEMRAVAGPFEVTRLKLSPFADTILVTRLIEINGEVRKGVTVLKHRGGPHATEIRELIISEQGLRVLGGFEGYQRVATSFPETDEGYQPDL